MSKHMTGIDSWRSLVLTKEQQIRGQINELTADVRNPPVNLERVGRKLGARIDRLIVEGPRDGTLQRDTKGWLVTVTNPHGTHVARDRFTIAHEFAHILFLEAGLDRPQKKGGYWILEEACHRLASDILVPERLGPHGHLTRETLFTWMQVLKGGWKLSTEAAAKCIVRRTTNCRSAAGLFVDGEPYIVKWSLTVNGVHPWPARFTHLKGGKFPEFRRLVLEYRHLKDQLEERSKAMSRQPFPEIDGLGGTLIGFMGSHRFIIFRKEVDEFPQMRLFEVP